MYRKTRAKRAALFQLRLNDKKLGFRADPSRCAKVRLFVCWPIAMKKVLLILVLLCGSLVQAAKNPAYKDLEWLDLMPKDEVEALQQSQSLPVDHEAKGEQQGSFRTVEGVDNTKVRLAGYVVPVEQNDAGEMTEFFFVPYFGACIHVPPPPPNNIVYVKMKKPIPAADMFNAYWLEGTLKVEKLSNDIAETAYTMQGDGLELYE